jgi:carboxyl-terminal processing protease
MKPAYLLFVLLVAARITVVVPAAQAQTDEISPPAEVVSEVDAEETFGDPNNAFTELELLAEVMIEVKRHYVDERSYRELIHGALEGMLQSLDPHSAFMGVDEYRDMQDGTSGHYSGIGIQVGMRDGILTVIAPFEGTPGFEAGLLAGDLILGIDGKRTTGVSLREAVNLMRGDRGATVVLTVLHTGESEPVDISVVRDDIEMDTVKGGTMLSDSIAYVRVVQFSDPTAAALHAEVARLVDEGAKGLVLDLRGNPGGLLTSAVDVSSIFLKRGELVVSTRGRNGRVISERRATSPRPFIDIPVAVLVNRGSASASEIVAGALQDHGRAVVVGETTYGKGSVQSVMEARADARTAIRLTTAHYYTPSARIIHEHGVEPDIPVYITPQEWRAVLIDRARREGLEPAEDGLVEPFAEAPPEVLDIQLARASDVLAAVNLFKQKRR